MPGQDWIKQMKPLENPKAKIVVEQKDYFQLKNYFKKVILLKKGVAMIHKNSCYCIIHKNEIILYRF